MTTPGSLERLLIIFMAMLQSLLLYAGWQGLREPFWPFTTPGAAVYWFTLSTSLPLVMMLSLTRLDDARFWQHVGGLLLTLTGLSAWAAWHVASDPPVRSLPVLLPFALSLGLGLYVVMPFLQARLSAGRWRVPYALLVQYSWQNGLTLLLAAVFVGLGWGLLLLSMRLFELIDIDWLDALLQDGPVPALVTGLLFGIGIVIARIQQRTARTLLHILVGLFTGLLPVLSVVILVFLASLAVTGVGQLWDDNPRSLWQSTSVTLVLSMLLAHQILFLNAVYQDGNRAAPYPRFFRWVIQMALLALPVIAALALYALWLRVEQHGLTTPRYWAAATLLILSLYSAGYALIQLVPHQRWLGHLPRVNVAMAVALMAVILAGNTPLLDPHRLAADWQLQRLRDLPAEEVEVSDLNWLRFQSGRHGPAALLNLHEEAQRNDDQELAEFIARLLEADEPLPPVAPATVPMPSPRPDQPLRVKVPDGAPAMDEAYLRFLQRDPGAVANCSGEHTECMVVRVDADNDGRDERLLCNLALTDSISCRLTHQTADGDWRWLTGLGWPRTPATEQALREGDIRTVPPRWQSLQLGDGPVFHLVDPERNVPALRRLPIDRPVP